MTSSQTMKLCYQSFVDDTIAATYLERLAAHLDVVAGANIVDVKPLSPPDSFAHPAMEFRCARDVVRNAITAEREGYDAFIVGHIQDSGLWEAKSVVDIPVIGLGEACMLYACMLGMRIGIVTINPRFIPGFHLQIKKYGLEKRVIGVHAMTFEPGELTAAFDSDEIYRGALESFREQAAPLVKNGVEVLIPGGGIPMLLFAEEQDFNVDGAPVVNGIPILVKMAAMAVELKRFNGLGVGRSSDMVLPPAHVIEELLGP
jgi:Asp/Glu/hydantoin racemase